MSYIQPFPWGSPMGGACPTCGRCPTCGQGGGAQLGGIPPWMQEYYDTTAPTTGDPLPEMPHTTCGDAVATFDKVTT